MLNEEFRKELPAEQAALQQYGNDINRAGDIFVRMNPASATGIAAAEAITGQNVTQTGQPPLTSGERTVQAASAGAGGIGILLGHIFRTVRAARHADDIIDAAGDVGRGGGAARGPTGGHGHVPTGGPYSHLPDHPSVGAGKDFTQTQRKKILEENKRAHGGRITSDGSGRPTVPGSRHTKGVTPPSNEAHIDHIVPKSKGGSNSYSNAQILTREENLKKGNRSGINEFGPGIRSEGIVGQSGGRFRFLEWYIW
jgi:hypothetical protein